jgi:hypothetical protein
VLAGIGEFRGNGGSVHLYISDYGEHRISPETFAKIRSFYKPDGRPYRRGSKKRAEAEAFETDLRARLYAAFEAGEEVPVI